MGFTDIFAAKLLEHLCVLYSVIQQVFGAYYCCSGNQDKCSFAELDLSVGSQIMNCECNKLINSNVLGGDR